MAAMEHLKISSKVAISLEDGTAELVFRSDDLLPIYLPKHAGDCR